MNGGLLASDAIEFFEVTLDASALLTGEMYKLCVDFSNASSNSFYGEVDLRVYVTGVNRLVTPVIILSTTN